MQKSKEPPGFFPHICPEASSVQRPHGRLPMLESILYLVCGVGSILYITYQLYLASQEYQWLLNEEDFTDGWSFIKHKKDISNYEWHFWSNYFWVILPWVAGHVFLARILEHTMIEYRKPVFLAYSLMCVSYLLGYRTVLFFMSHAAVCYLASSLGSFAFVWIVALLLLLTLNYEIFMPIMKQLCGISKDQGNYYQFVFVLALVILRYTSFCLERSKLMSANKRKKQTGERKIEESGDNSSGTKANWKTTNDEFGLMDMFQYIFYLPLFFTGPLITYDKFKVQIACTPAPWTLSRITSSIKGFVRVIFWALFLELSHHFLYYSALQTNIGTVREMSVWALVGIGYLEGQYFMVKYLVMYDLPGQVARLDDLNPPLGPKCISYIYRYSDMWKYFDRGLYTFLRNYIYIPLGGSQVGLVRRLLASVACFLYIYVWHGQEYYLLLWCMANYVGCSVELLGGQFEETGFVTKLKTYVSPAMVRRVRCVIAVPLFLTSCFAIFYFFGGVAVGDMFLHRLVTGASTNGRIVLYFLIYVNLQNAMAVERWMSGRASKHVKAE